MPKRIGLLTSGGDCAGLNALIRSVYLAAKEKNWSVIGIEDGIPGLIARPIKQVNIDDIFGSKYGYALQRMGGTCLGTLNFSKSSKKSYMDYADEFVEGYRKLNLDALIASGGDGSLNVLRKLCLHGNIPFVGVPKTIDNDISYTDSLGFATAVEVATEALNRLQPTAASHSRVMILEVMGRDAGNIALHAGIAGDADIILLPEIPFDLEVVAEKIKKIKERGRSFALIVAAESAHPVGEKAKTVAHKNGGSRYGGIGTYLCDTLETYVDAEIRSTALGHVQRGGHPVYRDRLIAAAFGAEAITCVEQGNFDRMVAWHNSTVTNIPLEKALNTYSNVDLDGKIIQSALTLGICLGASKERINSRQ